MTIQIRRHGDDERDRDRPSRRRERERDRDDDDRDRPRARDRDRDRDRDADRARPAGRDSARRRLADDDRDEDRDRPRRRSLRDDDTRDVAVERRRDDDIELDLTDEREGESRRRLRERGREDEAEEARDTERARLRESASSAGRAVSNLRASRTEEVRKRERMTEDAIWYLSWASQRVGPVNLQAVQNYISQGKLKPGHYVWRHGFSEWKFAYEVPEISSLFPETMRKEKSAIARLLGVKTSDPGGGTAEEKPAVLFCPHCGVAQDPDRAICQGCHQPTGFAKVGTGVFSGLIGGGNYASWPKEKLEKLCYVRRFHHSLAAFGALGMLVGILTPWFTAGERHLFGFAARGGTFLVILTLIGFITALFGAARKVSRKRSLVVFLAALGAAVILTINVLDAQEAPLFVAQSANDRIGALAEIGARDDLGGFNQLASAGVYIFGVGIAFALVFALFGALAETASRPAAALTAIILVGGLALGSISLSLGHGYGAMIRGWMKMSGYADVQVTVVDRDHIAAQEKGRVAVVAPYEEGRVTVFEVIGVKAGEEKKAYPRVRFGSLRDVFPVFEPRR
ncbi:MAG: DUF4339 domain-containing protein [Planctomycetes bacterium]|nr:DUF4339 domain-containing protein [Planctomycetota bacterium]